MTVQLTLSRAKRRSDTCCTGFATGYAMTSDAEAKKTPPGVRLEESIRLRAISGPVAWILPSMAKDDVAQILNRTAAANACDATVTMTTSFTGVGP